MKLQKICLWKEVIDKHDPLDETQELFELMKRKYDCHKCDGNSTECPAYSEIYRVVKNEKRK